MPAAVDLVGSTVLAIVIATLFAHIITRVRRDPRHLPLRYAVIAAIAFAGLAVPVKGLPLIAHLRGVLGDPSVPLVVVALAASATRLRLIPAAAPRDRLATATLAVAAAALIYPFALGLAAFDPYRLGFGSSWFAASVLALGLVAIVLRYTLASIAICASVLAWTSGLYASANLVDYLLDPLLAGWGMAQIVVAMARRERDGER